MSSTPAIAHVIAFEDLQDRPAASDAMPLRPGSNPLHRVKARLQVCVGDVIVTVGELMALRENQVLTLNQSIDAPVDVLLEGRVIARGQLVAVDDEFGVRITELPVALRP